MADHRSVYPDGWIPGIDILLAIGSGEMKATPLQVAQAYGALATGKLCRPHLVSRIEGGDGDVHETRRRHCRKIPYTQAALLHPGSPAGGDRRRHSVHGLLRLSVRGRQDRDRRAPAVPGHVVVRGVVPAEDPQYIVVATVEQGGFGAETAAPIVRNIMSRIYRVPCQGPELGSSED